MAVDVEELIIGPFKEVVERGHEALANATDTQDEAPDVAAQLSKAAQAVVREGERALKRLQPLWDAHVERHGDVFKDAVAANDEIAERRRILEDLLYDFEDFVEITSFEAAKFTELQAATKAFALDTLDAIKRLKIDDSTPKTSSLPPAHAFPPLPPLPLTRTGTQSSRASRPSTVAGAESPSESVPSLSYFPQPPGTPGDQPTFGTKGVRTSVVSRGHRTSDLQRAASSRTSSVYSADGQPNQPRRVETWSAPVPIRQPQPEQPQPLRRQTSVETQMLSPPGSIERRPSSPSVLGDEVERVRIVGGPTKPSPAQSLPSPTYGTLPRTTAWVSEQSGGSQQQRFRTSPRGASIPEDATVLGTASPMTIEPMTASGRVVGNGIAARPARHQQDEHHTRADQPYMHSGMGTMFLADPTSPATTNRTSLFSDTHTASTSASGPPGSETRTSSLTAFAMDKELPGLLTLPPVGEHDDGLMLATEVADSEASGTQIRHSSTTLREADCVIGHKSTFHQMKGFCDGAEAFRKTSHTQGLKQAPAYGQSVVVGRCTSCEYNNIYSEVMLDLGKDSRANYAKCGVLYRVRFVFKSHMTVRNVSEIRYACLFCTQAGHTVREGDATVFQTLDSLMRHLSRHPQPLPEVAGVTVLYGRVEAGSAVEEDYDLHFPDGPAAGPASDGLASSLPSATAIKGCARRAGEKALLDPDGGEGTLGFLAGARVVGVEFPARWGGKWCVGWHDGVRGAFPAKLVEVEGPRQSEISLQSASAVSVTARWKWSPRDPERVGWLSFDKGETIRNVGWLYQDHWCWTGMNAKGKFGVFPASHVDHDSIKESRDVGRRPTTSKGGFFGLRRKSISTESSYS